LISEDVQKVRQHFVVLDGTKATGQETIIKEGAYSCHIRLQKTTNTIKGQTMQTYGKPHIKQNYSTINVTLFQRTK